VSGGRAARRGAGAAWALGAALLFACPAPAADLEAGRRRAQDCFACHGPEGNSTNPAMSSLAGQPAQFIAMQLFQFREGNRKDPKMTPPAVGLSNADLNDLAAYFSAQKPAMLAKAPDPATAAAGRRLTEQHHCVQCHGAALMGQQHIPRLAGQQRGYLRVQLRGFKAGTRADIDGFMTSATQLLSDKEIEILADYLSGLGGQ